MRFEVPQFVDIEDKIFGPLTFKQFIYIAGGVGVSIVAWVLLPKLIAIIIIGVAMGFGVALAFYNTNSTGSLSYSSSRRPYVMPLEQSSIFGRKRLGQS
jgi:hypothetical protein